MNTSGSTFSHVFGTNTSPFELLVVKRKIMGPGWLEIKDAVVSSKSVSGPIPRFATAHVVSDVMVQNRVQCRRSETSQPNLRIGSHGTKRDASNDHHELVSSDHRESS